ncbi:MAG: hypothetical protein LBJ62_01280 [Bifidobacteriaceae bacterium]|nr:hypothetical protein [Bifidobacteriaceae bacterium]
MAPSRAASLVAGMAVTFKTVDQSPVQADLRVMEPGVDGAGPLAVGFGPRPGLRTGL